MCAHTGYREVDSKFLFRIYDFLKMFFNWQEHICSWWVRSMENKFFPTHEHKLAKKTLRDGSNGELTLEDRKRGLCSHTNVADGDSTKTHVVDVVVHLT
jgi:hypothetical protein